MENKHSQPAVGRKPSNHVFLSFSGNVISG
jgi:hypothetical protein